jgi:hypothetical protein
VKILVIVAVCIAGYLVAGQCAWVLYGWIKDGKALWLTPWGLREAVEDRMPTDVSGLPLALLLWVFMSVAWPFPLGITVSEDLRERRERLEQRKREAWESWRSRSRLPSAAPVDARPDTPDD